MPAKRKRQRRGNLSIPRQIKLRKGFSTFQTPEFSPPELRDTEDELREENKENQQGFNASDTESVKTEKTKSFSEEKTDTFSENIHEDTKIEGVEILLKERCTISTVKKKFISQSSYDEYFIELSNPVSTQSSLFIPISNLDKLSKTDIRQVLLPFKYFLNQKIRNEVKEKQYSNGIAILLILNALIVRVAEYMLLDNEKEAFFAVLFMLKKLTSKILETWSSAENYAVSKILGLSLGRTEVFLEHSEETDVGLLELLLLRVVAGKDLVDSNFFVCVWLREWFVHRMGILSQNHPDIPACSLEQENTKLCVEKLFFHENRTGLQIILAFALLSSENETNNYSADVFELTTLLEFKKTLFKTEKCIKNSGLSRYIFGASNVEEVLKWYGLESRFRSKAKMQSFNREELLGAIKEHELGKQQNPWFRLCLQKETDFLNVLSGVKDEVKRLDEELNEKNLNFDKLSDEKRETEKMLYNTKQSLKELRQTQAITKSKEKANKNLEETEDPDVNMVFTDEHLYQRSQSRTIHPLQASLKRIFYVFTCSGKARVNLRGKDSIDKIDSNQLKYEMNILKEELGKKEKEVTVLESDLDGARANELILQKEIQTLKKKLRKYKSRQSQKR
eukprot:snap_masked-scaffold_6-processed-gene-13.15-mRNA-1 protein AED:1.00 eAED:1.00 QI:0/-1/0/0/-1/1/1/0/620